MKVGFTAQQATGWEFDFALLAASLAALVHRRGRHRSGSEARALTGIVLESLVGGFRDWGLVTLRILERLRIFLDKYIPYRVY